MNLEPPAYPLHQQINPLLHGRNPFTQGTLVGPTATDVSSQISAMLNPSAVIPATLANRINNSIATVTSVRREGGATRVKATITAITAPVASSSTMQPTPFYVSYHRDDDGRLVSDMVAWQTPPTCPLFRRRYPLMGRQSVQDSRQKKGYQLEFPSFQCPARWHQM